MNPFKQTVPVMTCTVEIIQYILEILYEVDECLNGLALKYIHPKISINVETIVDHYDSVQPAKKPVKI